MDFLEKLDHLMEINHLNKSSLSKACDIPYTTIDGWYKKGYEGLKLSTLRKLANYFGTSLDYWATEDNQDISASKRQLLEMINILDDNQAKMVSAFVRFLKEEETREAGNIGEQKEA